MREQYDIAVSVIRDGLSRYLTNFSESPDAPSNTNQATFVVNPTHKVETDSTSASIYHLASVTFRLDAAISYVDLPLNNVYGLWSSLSFLWLSSSSRSLDSGVVPIVIDRGIDVSDDWLITLQWCLCSASILRLDPSSIPPYDNEPLPDLFNGNRINLGLWRSPIDTVDKPSDDSLVIETGVTRYVI